MSDIVKRIADITTDWNGARMVDGESPRIVPTCGELRSIAAHIERLEAALRFYADLNAHENLPFDIARKRHGGRDPVVAFRGAGREIEAPRGCALSDVQLDFGRRAREALEEG